MALLLEVLPVNVVPTAIHSGEAADFMKAIAFAIYFVTRDMFH
jgi:hypothetical protein